MTADSRSHPARPEDRRERDRGRVRLSGLRHIYEGDIVRLIDKLTLATYIPIKPLTAPRQRR